MVITQHGILMHSTQSMRVPARFSTILLTRYRPVCRLRDANPCFVRILTILLAGSAAARAPWHGVESKMRQRTGSNFWPVIMHAYIEGDLTGCTSSILLCGSPRFTTCFACTHKTRHIWPISGFNCIQVTYQHTASRVLSHFSSVAFASHVPASRVFTCAPTSYRPYRKQLKL
jgi:hypothetical protein